MKILILGGDGFCGWPTSLHLANLGHNVIIVDNLSRRKIDIDLGTNSLTPISSIATRLEVWNKRAKTPIQFVQLDLANEYDRLLSLLQTEHPDAVVHFANNDLHLTR